MSTATIECCKCGWTGTDDEMKQIPSEQLKRQGFIGSDLVCPHCECDDFYMEEVQDEHD